MRDSIYGSIRFYLTERMYLVDTHGLGCTFVTYLRFLVSWRVSQQGVDCQWTTRAKFNSLGTGDPGF